MQKNSQNFSMQEALRLAKSDAGQQLLAHLQRADGEHLKQAMEQAAAGNQFHSRVLLIYNESPQGRGDFPSLYGVRIKNYCEKRCALMPSPLGRVAPKGLM